jgi:hypothetical protein
MEDLELKPEDLRIDSLGQPAIASPLGLSTEYGDNIVNY